MKSLILVCGRNKEKRCESARYYHRISVDAALIQATDLDIIVSDVLNALNHYDNIVVSCLGATNYDRMYLFNHLHMNFDTIMLELIHDNNTGDWFEAPNWEVIHAFRIIEYDLN